MHARNRTWPLGSDPAERCRQRTMPVEGGDGSTLSLDFTSGVIDPRLTFTRTTNATFINSSGLVEWAGANAMTQSNDFSVSPWAVSNVSVSIDGTSPVGNAWKILENSANDVHRLNPGGISSGIPGTGVPVSISIHVKQGSGSRQAYMLISDNGTGDVRSKRLDPVTGTLVGTESSGGSWSNASTSVQNLGNGWYRLTLTATRGGGSALICRTGLSDSSGNLTYQGDGTSFLYFSGHQINPGSTAQQYYATTGSAYHAPRFDYDPTSIGTPRGLLIEGAATNLAFRSNTLNSTSATEWVNANCLTPAIASGINDPSGGSDTWKVIAATGSAIHSWRNAMGGSTMTSGTAYTISVWARPEEYDRIIISDPGGGTSACTFVMQGSGTATAINNAGIGTCTNPVMVPYKDGWWRCSATFTRVDGSSANRSFGVAGYPSGATTSAFGATYNGDGTSGVYLYGWMMETGSGASSYIPTGASQGSRAADNLEVTGTNFSSWWPNPTAEFTVQWVGDLVKSPATAQFIWLSRASGSSKARNYVQTNSVIRGNSSVVDFTMSPATTATVGVVFKTAMAVKSGDSAMYVNNGTTIGNQADATSGTTTNHDSLYFNPNGDNFMHLKQFKFWPLRLPNATLLALVS